jgi:flagellar protein FliJ
MAIKRSKRMSLVLDMAIKTEQSAAEALEQARQQVAHAQQQLEQVAHYRQGYEDELNQPKKRVSVEALMNDRQFLSQLIQVVQTQTNQVQQLENNEQNCLHNWQLCYQRRRNIESLIDKLKTEENALSDKNLQKEMDELSMVLRRNAQ